MYFYLSKTLGLFAVPSNFIPLVVICGVLLWATRYARLGRRIAISGIVLLLIAGMTPLGTALLLPLESRFPQWNAVEGHRTVSLCSAGLSERTFHFCVTKYHSVPPPTA
jgi:uncharacterized SAM-binding protein YcdF (DUF218 family)